MMRELHDAGRYIAEGARTDDDFELGHAVDFPELFVV